VARGDDKGEGGRAVIVALSLWSSLTQDATTAEGGREDDKGGGSSRPTCPARSRTPSMLSIFGWMINPASCLGGRGSLPSLIVFDDNLNNALPLLLSSSSSAVDSLLDCSLLRYCPADNEDHKDDDHGEAAAPRGPGALVSGLLARVLSSPRTLLPPPSLSLSLSYANAPNYDDNLVHDGRAASRQRWGGKHSTDRTETLMLFL
jgi:hypothetical protein